MDETKKRRKLVFSRGGKSKTGKFCVLAVADEPKTPKNDFRPRPTNQKREKLTFGHGRKSIIH